MNKTQLYYEIGQKYSQISSAIGLDEPFYLFVSEYVIRYLFEFKNSKLLEAGCGKGGLGKVLKNKIFDFEYHAFDISQVNIEKAQKENDCIIYSKQYLPNINYQEKYFDIIILSEVLEHLAEPLASLNSLRKVLKDNGNIIVTIPNGDMLGFQDYLNSRSVYQPTDDYFYTYGEAQNLFRKAGLRIITYDGWGHILNYNSRMPRIRRKITRMFNKILKILLPDVERRMKRILFVLQKDDYLLNHDF